MIGPPPGRGGPQIIPRPAGARPGGAPPWAHIPERKRHVDLGQLEARLANGSPRLRGSRSLPAHQSAQDLTQGRTSAVLVPLYESDGEPMVVLTRRSPTLRTHGHEVAFPGGRRDDDDRDLTATALRESQEEVGLEPRDVRIVGELDRFVTVGSQSLVHPFVGVLPTEPTYLEPNPDEVEHILYVRLSELLSDEVWREELWQIHDETWYPVTFFELANDTVWGATAQMLRELLAIATATHQDR